MVKDLLYGQNVFLVFAEKGVNPERWARQTHPALPGWQSEHGIHFILPGQPWQRGRVVRAPDLQFWGPEFKSRSDR